VGVPGGGYWGRCLKQVGARSKLLSKESAYKYLKDALRACGRSNELLLRVLSGGQEECLHNVRLVSWH